MLADVALDIAAERGIKATTTRAVAKGSGWSTGVLNYYFRSRKDLLLGTLRRAAEIQGRMFKKIRLDKHMDPVERIQSLVESVLPLDNRRLALTRIFLVFYAEAVSDSTTRDEISGYLQNWRRVVERAIREAQASNQIDSELDPVRLAIELVALSDGLAMHAILDPEISDWVREHGVGSELFDRPRDFQHSRDGSAHPHAGPHKPS